MPTPDSTLRLQDASRDSATRHRHTRTNRDFDHALREDISIMDLARISQRTYYAAATMRRDGRRGHVPSTRVAASDRPYRGFLEGMVDPALT